MASEWQRQDLNLVSLTPWSLEAWSWALDPQLPCCAKPVLKWPKQGGRRKSLISSQPVQARATAPPPHPALCGSGEISPVSEGIQGSPIQIRPCGMDLRILLKSSGKPQPLRDLKESSYFPSCPFWQNKSKLVYRDCSRSRKKWM